MSKVDAVSSGRPRETEADVDLGVRRRATVTTTDEVTREPTNPKPSNADSQNFAGSRANERVARAVRVSTQRPLGSSRQPAEGANVRRHTTHVFAANSPNPVPYWWCSVSTRGHRCIKTAYPMRVLVDVASQMRPGERSEVSFVPSARSSGPR